MNRGFAPSICMVMIATVSLGGCKLEKNDVGADGQSQKVVSSQPGGDMNALVADIWEKQVLPHLDETSTDMAELVTAIASGLDAAGDAKGYRPASEGSPWNFSTKVKGKIVSAKTDTRAATADVDVDGDGTADVTLQLGPVIRGTALRDILPFIDFSSFTDQIEYAKLSRALNARAFESALEDLPRDNLEGQQVEALGAFTVRGGGPPFLVTPVTVKVGG
ncbi:MAG: DUF2291 domain-containing protein [Roseibium sp.]